MAGKRKLTGKQLRGLFARGILRSTGSGKNRRVVYNKSANATSARKFGRRAKSGRASTSNVSDPFAKSGRAVIGGSKVSGLRSGGGSGRKYPASQREAVIARQRAAVAQRFMSEGLRESRLGIKSKRLGLAERARAIQGDIRNEAQRSGKRANLGNAFEAIRNYMAWEKDSAVSARITAYGNREPPRRTYYVDNSSLRLDGIKRPRVKR